MSEERLQKILARAGVASRRKAELIITEGRVTVNGTVITELGTKAEDLELHRSGAVKFLAHEPQELRIRRIGSDVAITALRARLRVQVHGNIVEGTYRYTRVWQKSGGRWQVAGGHVSEVPSRV